MIMLFSFRVQLGWMRYGLDFSSILDFYRFMIRSRGELGFGKGFYLLLFDHIYAILYCKAPGGVHYNRFPEIWSCKPSGSIAYIKFDTREITQRRFVDKYGIGLIG